MVTEIENSFIAFAVLDSSYCVYQQRCPEKCFVGLLMEAAFFPVLEDPKELSILKA